MNIIHDLSPLKLDGECERTMLENTELFLQFCIERNIHTRDTGYWLFILT